MNLPSLLVILDLDETLIHTTTAPLNNQMAHLKMANYWLYERPYVRDFISFCLSHFRVAVWTSSNEPYAHAVITHLFEQPEQLEFIWARQRCTVRMDHQRWEPFYVKNLKKVKALGERLERIIMLDDSPEKLIHQYGNLVRISPFEGQANDKDLLLLMNYLLYLNQQPNVRDIEKRGWQQHMLHQAIQQQRAQLYASGDADANEEI